MARVKNKDIAEQLGISPTAVSLALNGKPGVSEETRRKVLALVSKGTLKSVAELGGTTGTLGRVAFCTHRESGAIIDDKPFFNLLVETAQAEVTRHGMDMVLCSYSAGQDLGHHLQQLRELSPRGIILQATELSRDALAQYKELGIPLVLVDGYFDLDDTDAVTLNDEEIALRSVCYLADRGHRSIGHLKGLPCINNFAHREDGYWKGLRAAGLMGENHPTVELPSRVEEAYEAMRAFLAGPPDGWEMPTAFYCDLDYIAIGAMRALQEAGFRVPDDVSIVSSDDISMAAFTVPALTTTRVNQTELGRTAAALLFERIEHPEAARHLNQVSSELVVRDSVAAPRE